ncbi:MAG: OmpA family protein [Elusimicrobiales bacterium]|nr:OmpA family protein [Elusimicrobiales bacterium]
MKIMNISAAVLFLAASAGAQTLPGADSLKEKAAAKGNVAYTAAKAAFNKAVKDIPFRYNSSELSLGDPKYKVAGVNVEEFMKKTMIPALVKVVELAPADKQVTITGHASRRGPEEAAGSFQGNIALSKARAEAVVAYLTANSSLPAGRFKVEAAGSSRPLSGKDPASEENCRVSIMME